MSRDCANVHSTVATGLRAATASKQASGNRVPRLSRGAGEKVRLIGITDSHPAVSRVGCLVNYKVLSHAAGLNTF